MFARPRDLGFVVVAVGGIVLALMLAIAVRRRRVRSALPPETPANTEAPRPSANGERQQLIRSLAELDERFEAGDVDEAAYRSEREAGKARLLALVASTTSDAP
jgi:hypothetical protein